MASLFDISEIQELKLSAWTDRGERLGSRTVLGPDDFKEEQLDAFMRELRAENRHERSAAWGEWERTVDPNVFYVGLDELGTEIVSLELRVVTWKQAAASVRSAA